MIQDILLLLGRLGMAAVFLHAGIMKLIDPTTTMHYMTLAGMPLVWPGFVVALIVENIGALALITGYKMRWAAFVMALFLIPVTYYFFVIPANRRASTPIWGS